MSIEKPISVSHANWNLQKLDEKVLQNDMFLKLNGHSDMVIFIAI